MPFRRSSRTSRWSSLSRPSSACALVLLLALTGCGGDDSRGELDASREQLQELGREVVADLETAGVPATEATGTFRQCQSEPAPGVGYRAAGATDPDDDRDPAERLAAIESVLADSGWELVDESGVPSLTVSRDGVTMTLRPTVRQGSSALTFDYNGPCVRADDDVSRPLLRESDDLLG